MAMTLGKGGFIDEDYQNVLDAFTNSEGLSREDIAERTGLNISRVNQILQYLDKNKRLIRNGRWLKDSTKFWVKKRK